MVRAGLALACVLALGGPAAAQQPAAQPGGRVFDQGPVVVISEVKIMPGQRRAYAQTLAGRWRMSMEAAKRRGEVLDYKIYENTHRREGEGHFYFVTTYKNAAVQDITFAERERHAAEGVAPGVPPPPGNPEALREVLSETMLRELVFRDPPPR
jgi:hypothetical protein